MARGLVCFGPNRRKDVTFVLIDQWLRKQPPVPSEVEAETALFRQYLRSFGPADLSDFRSWSGMGFQRARAIAERLRGELVEVEADGHSGYFLKKDVSDLEESRDVDRGVVNLLPSFDPFLLGHRHRAHLVDEAHYRHVYKDAGWLAPVLLRGGRVVGTWHYGRRASTLDVEVRMFGPLDSVTRGRVKEQAQDLARFLEIPDVATRFAE